MADHDPDGSPTRSVGVQRDPLEDLETTRSLSSPAIGQVTKIANRYLLTSLLGRGGFGEVYQARDEILNRDVAVKILMPASGAEDLLREARLIAALDHPSIVPVYDAGLHQGRCWIAMRLVRGPSLAALLGKEGLLPPGIAVQILKSMASALQHAHRHRLVHRDVKPSNILIESKERVEPRAWLMDFGLAKIRRSLESSEQSRVAGTPAYMAPEQITGRRIDERTDLYSLGCVAIEMITGTQAFAGDSYHHVMHQIIHEAPRGLADLEEKAGSRFARLIRRLLAKSPHDRYPSAGMLLRDLELLNGEWSEGAQRADVAVQSVRTIPGPAWESEGILIIKGLRKRYSFRKPVLNGIDLTLPSGSIYALIGKNGAGKSTLLQTAIGLMRRDAGTVSLFGQDPQRHPGRINARIGYVSDQLNAYDSMTLNQLLQYMRPFYRNWDESYCLKLMSRFELSPAARLRALSRGMKTKVALLCALAHQPELLVLDDPTLGLDAMILQEFFELLAEIRDRQGTTVLISSHHLDELGEVATHAAFLQNGSILLDGALDELCRSMLRVTMTFQGRAPAPPVIKGFFPISSSGDRIIGVCAKSSEDSLQKLRDLRPELVETDKVRLRDLFVSLLR